MYFSTVVLVIICFSILFRLMYNCLVNGMQVHDMHGKSGAQHIKLEVFLFEQYKGKFTHCRSVAYFTCRLAQVKFAAYYSSSRVQ